ncbi:MAG: DUF72 domain-containing protein [Bdellovibrionaceae bacterium]|nr:DUF72 domain-containing protein [Pseudobdellovibrionaceae bacterium]
MDSRLEKLRAKGIYIGTSSWKYEGWKDLIYHRPYRSQKHFNEECLNEYAEHFTAVGVDHTYYAWPNPSQIKRYAEHTPASFRFCLKATERVTVFQYPKLKRYGKEAGKLNEHFLNAGEFEDNFLIPLEPFSKRLGPILIEFSHFYPGMISSGREFVEKLDQFLSQVARHKAFEFAVEIRNSNWICAPYFETLKRHGVGHVFNSWTRVPTIGEQMDALGDIPLALYAARLLLSQGTKYEQAVEAFSPYNELKETHPAVRQQAAELIRRAQVAGISAYVFVNNRFEGCAPLTIAAILDSLER